MAMQITPDSVSGLPLCRPAGWIWAWRKMADCATKDGDGQRNRAAP